MIGLLCFALAVLGSPFRSKLRLAAENAVLRHQSTENPLWGAPRIHGELLKLGFEVAQSSVAKYMVKRRGPPSVYTGNLNPDVVMVKSTKYRG
jgi:hypothetical protein